MATKYFDGKKLISVEMCTWNERNNQYGPDMSGDLLAFPGMQYSDQYDDAFAVESVDDIIDFAESWERGTDEWTKEALIEADDPAEIQKEIKGRFVGIDVLEETKDMPIEEKILRNDASNHYTEYDIQTQLKRGILWYENYEDYYADCIAGLNDPEDIPEMWDRLDTSTVDGIVYHYDCIL